MTVSLPANAASPSSGELFGQQRDGEELPESIGPYRILSLLGKGGMGIVYLAAQTEPVRRQVAVKVMMTGRDTGQFLARFESERQALALMSHSSIARVHDAGATREGRPYYVMEHVAGIPLGDHCRKNRLGVRGRLDLFIQICEGVQHAHQKAVIHRDLKPGNILVTTHDEKPTPKIIDFGLAKAVGQRLTDKPFETMLGMPMGTWEYMSPEQASGSQDVDTRADIYSLGVILYELLTGCLPFDSKTLREAPLAEAQRIICEEEPPRPSARLTADGDRLRSAAEERGVEPKILLRQIRGDLGWIVMKAIEKDRGRRYATVRELAADVRRHLDDQPVLARAPTFFYRARKLARRNRARLGAAAVVLCVAAGFTGYALYSREQTFREDRAAASSAIRGEDLAGAGKALARLEGSHPGHPVVASLARQVAALDRRIKIQETRKHLEDGLRSSRRFFEQWAELAELEQQVRRSMEALEPWQPVWEREAELRARADSKRLQAEREKSYNQSVTAFSRAREIAPIDSAEHRQIREELEKVYWAGYEETIEKGVVTFSREFFKSMIEIQGIGTHAEELEGASQIALESDPPGAEVFCFRYVEEPLEGRLVPLPFDPRKGGTSPAAGIAGKPFLEVERIWDPHHQVFAPGDRVLEVDGRAVSLRGDLAKALSGVGANQSVNVKLLRAGKELVRSWTPFPEPPSWRPPTGRKESTLSPDDPCRPGRLVDIYAQLGLTFAGCPLEFSGDCKVGLTEASSALKVRLPRGSYLLVLRKPGHAEARLPLVVPAAEGARKIRLYRDGEEIPGGYLHVPAGPFASGGDGEAYLSLEAMARDVGDFFMRRLEVTFEEYLEFLNDPEVLARLDAEHMQRPDEGWSEEELRIWPEELKEIDLLPYWEKDDSLYRLCRRAEDGNGWKLVPQALPDWPVFGIPMLAGIEYAHWLSRRAEREGRPWRFRLPRDLEWEKAARGADRRIHVWGEYLVGSFCRSPNGSSGDRALGLDPVGVFPLDESPYGIRDMEGSIQEPCLSKVQDLRMVVYHGGGWWATDDSDYRAATRNRILPEATTNGNGLRLVAEPVPNR